MPTATPIQAPYYPIIYVRGFAATMGEIEETVASPYMGFNLGSTKIRQTQEKNEVTRFVFESPLLRLMKDEGYTDAYQAGDIVDSKEPHPARSVWVFRYYDKDSESFGDGEKDEIVSYAEDLEKFIHHVRAQVCQGDAALEAKFKVHLVAHSMGGLICRTYLQNVARGKDHLVDKVFTYATPHRGIEVFGRNTPDLGRFDSLHLRNFNREYMREYLKLTPGEQVNSLDGHFPPERFFSFVGTNHRDYDAFFGLSRRGTGASSDGLVMMRNAYVKDSPRAFAHRSHSGHYGIVNSEEGYQNLRRFLFGNVRIDAMLKVHELLLPPAVQKRKEEGGRIRARYNIDAAAKVRGGTYHLSERRVRLESAIRQTYENMVEEGKEVYLYSGYLAKSAKTDATDTALAFSLDLSVEVPLFEVDRRFWLDEHFEGSHLFADSVCLHLRQQKDGMTLKYGLRSEQGAGVATKPLNIQEVPGSTEMQVEIPLGFAKGAARPPRPGMRATLFLRFQPWV